MIKNESWLVNESIPLVIIINSMEIDVTKRKEVLNRKR